MTGDLMATALLLLAVLFGLLLARLLAAVVVAVGRLLAAEWRWRRMLRALRREERLHRLTRATRPSPRGTQTW